VKENLNAIIWPILWSTNLKQSFSLFFSESFGDHCDLHRSKPIFTHYVKKAVVLHPKYHVQALLGDLGGLALNLIIPPTALAAGRHRSHLMYSSSQCLSTLYSCPSAAESDTAPVLACPCDACQFFCTPLLMHSLAKQRSSKLDTYYSLTGRLLDQKVEAKSLLVEG
jgi:hypothetical protein